MAPRVQKPAHLGERPREWLPARRWLPTYQRRWLKGDLIAGSVVAALAIPQSLGYASIAGLPVQVGLYSLPTVLVVYALLGSSPRHVGFANVFLRQQFDQALVQLKASGEYERLTQQYRQRYQLPN